ncbi:hypothetical protein C7S14_0942 [Burkholderia cepacia]|nr:hypothetical protein C7S14_0942 [Burkholderia cepacia]
MYRHVRPTRAHPDPDIRRATTGRLHAVRRTDSGASLLR